MYTDTRAKHSCLYTLIQNGYSFCKHYLNHVLNFQAHPNKVQILMAVVKYKTNLYKPRTGVCSTWLASLDQDEKMKNVKIPVWIKKATISFPKSLESPVIMIGPGRHDKF